MGNTVLAFGSEIEWREHWTTRKSNFRFRSSAEEFRKVASFVGGSLHFEGFRLFDNAGVPQLLRLGGGWREEILLVPAPRMLRRQEMPFVIRVHLSSPEVGNIRSRYWRPACRAPEAVASGNIGLLKAESVYYTFLASAGQACAREAAEAIMGDVIPWLQLFHEPDNLRRTLYENEVPLVDESTAVEIMLAYFDPFEARRFLRYRELNVDLSRRPIPEVSGHDLSADRIGPIRAYYRLGTR